MVRAVAGTSLALAALAMAGTAFGQIDASTPAFEVASVKVSAPLPNGVMAFRIGALPASTDPGRVDYKGVTLKNLIARAYDVRDYQVEGPEWLDGERYDVIATIPQGSDKSQVGLMVQRLLAERFKLTLHHESKPMAVYTLSVAKGGPKLKEIDPDKLPPIRHRQSECAPTASSAGRRRFSRAAAGGRHADGDGDECPAPARQWEPNSHLHYAV